MEWRVARDIKRAAKRANRPNPREDRNLPEFITKSGRYGMDRDNVVAIEQAPSFRGKYQQQQSHQPIRAIKRVALLPRNLAQEVYVEALNDDRKSMVFAMGPAGTGKTMLGTQFAIKRYIEEGKRIVVTRPAVSVDEQHGFLPGSLIQKMEPWVMPILDVFREHFEQTTIRRMLENSDLEIAPLAYMRGRTFKDATVLGDEMQNALPSQMKMLLTRIGEGSRMIITGDLKQHDRGFEQNGLRDFVHRLRERGSDKIAVIEFDPRDIERHPVIEDILDIYGDD
jgi:phosphate starvation-inducible PhoH-like protein